MQVRGKNTAVRFFLGYWLSAEAPQVTIFPFTQQGCIAQPSPGSAGGAKGALSHNYFYTDSSTGKHSPARLQKQAQGSVCMKYRYEMAHKKIVGQSQQLV